VPAAAVEAEQVLLVLAAQAVVVTVLLVLVGHLLLELLIPAVAGAAIGITSSTVQQVALA
jgi:hypothetical protein